MPFISRPNINPTYRQHKSSQLKASSAKTPNSDFVSRSERVVKAAADRAIQHHAAIQEVIGERPYGTKKVPERQQVMRYMTVRDNPQAWSKLLSEHGPKATIEYALRMERLCEKYPDAVEYLNPGPLEDSEL